MLKKTKKILLPFLNISIFIAAAYFINYFLWDFFGKDYVFGPPVGGDYYNALTYLLHVIDHSPNPASGWFSFWNEGAPYIGGYPFLIFYLLKPFAAKVDPLVLMNTFSYITLSLFFISSLLLFWQVSKNWIFAFGLIVLLLMTGSSYYQLTTGGFIVSASAQFYLPLTLFAIYRFLETKKGFYLFLASLINGISLLHQAPSSLLMVFAPSFLALSFSHTNLKIKQRLLYIGAFAILSTLIGSTGLYSVFLQNFLGSGTGKCISAQCWGDYPTHLIRWFSPLPPIFAIVLSTAAVISKVFKRSIKISIAIPSIAALLFFTAYCAAAYFKLIDGLANVLFPTRTFWAINLLILTTAGASFFAIKKTLGLFSHFVAIFVLALSLLFVFQKPLKIHKDFTATLPMAAHEYAIPKFQTKSLSQIFHDWVIASDQNFRIDIGNAAINQWYYYVFQTPSTRGYSNHPLGTHRDWQYFLEVSTRNTKPQSKTDEEIIKNRSLFLIDAFGIGIFETSQSNYPKSILEDEKIITRKPVNNELFWWEISKDYTSPIVSAISSTPILFVGNDFAYNYFIRAIAMTNLNSKIAIPVRGPESVDDLSKKDLEEFSAIFVYDSSKSPKNFSRLENYIKNGGKVFIETSSLEKDLEKLPEIFPTKILEQQNISVSNSEYEIINGEFKKAIKSEKFSPLTQNGTPWKIASAKESDLKNWAKPVLAHAGRLVAADGNFGQGYVFQSGLNLPYHIVKNNNLEEAKLLNLAILKLTNNPKNVPQFQVTRNKPELVTIDGQNANGIYFKENFHSGWKAKINGSGAKIYKAGLDFMYVKLPPNTQKILATIEFKGNITTHFLYYLSLTSLFISILLLALPKLIKKIALTLAIHINKKLSKRFQKILQEDENIY